MEPFHPDVAIMFAFNGRPPVFGLTAPLDQELPTWRIKSMSLRRVGPERKTGCRKTTPGWGQPKAACNNGGTLDFRVWHFITIDAVARNGPVLAHLSADHTAEFGGQAVTVVWETAMPAAGTDDFAPQRDPMNGLK